MDVRVAVIGAVWLLGCGPVVDLNEDESSGGSQGTSNAATATATATATTTSSTSASTSGTPATTSGSADSTADDMDTFDSVGFIIDCGAAPAGSSHHCIARPESCNLVLQDCVAGEKCNPWANDGGTAWNATLCVPVSNAPVGVGEPCTLVGNPWSALDDCGLGLFCVAQDEGSLMGVCWALCSAGPGDEPACETGTCVWQPGELELPVCEPACDPVLQDCVHGPCDAGREPFGCKPAMGSGAALGDACDGVGDCVAGATCLDADGVPGCATSACCTAYCDRLAPDPDLACGDGLVCMDWFAPGTAPAGYEHVGACVAG